MSTAASPYTIPAEPGASRAWILALLTHGLLFAFLFFGVRWQNQAPAVIQAEIWSQTVEIAAPAVATQPIEVAPAPEPPAPKIAAPVKETPPVKADIALKKEAPKKKKEEPKPEPKLKEKLVEKAPPKAAQKPATKVEAKPKVVAKPPGPLAPAAPSELASLLAKAAKPSTGTAAQSAGPRNDSAYESAIRTKILSNLRFPLPPDLSGNPVAIFMIEQLPSGEIVKITKRKASGLPAFDAAVERAIEASSPLPKAADGRIERNLELVFSPLDKR